MNSISKKSTHSVIFCRYHPIINLGRMVEQQNDRKSLTAAAATATALMQASVRPIFTLLLVTFLTGILIIRFSISLPRSAADYAASAVHLDPVLLNSTIADLAESDPGEEALNNDIALLLEGSFEKLARSPSFLIWRRYFVSVDLRSPSFRRLYDLHFRPLLSAWSSRRKSSLRLPAEETLSRLPPILGLGKKYSSCAVVGNSGILLNAEHGGEIDAHEAVIRLNNARINSFPKHVGTKTTLSFINSNILHLCARRRDCFCHPYGAAVPILLYLCQPLHLLDYATCNATSHDRAPFHVTDPAFDLLCAKIVKYYSLRRWFTGGRNNTLQGWFKAHDGLMFHYSSGMQAVLTAVGACEKVSLFGFGKAATARHHYHTNQRSELDLHDYEAEYEFYQDLVRSHTIPFLAGANLPPVQIYH